MNTNMTNDFKQIWKTIKTIILLADYGCLKMIYFNFLFNHAFLGSIYAARFLLPKASQRDENNDQLQILNNFYVLFNM